jgi:hypothetical protein
LDFPGIEAAANARFPLAQHGDRIETQKATFLAVLQLMRDGPPEIGNLDTLFALERHAQSVNEQLLTRYVEGDDQSRQFDWNAWRGALQISQSFSQTCERFLDYARQSSDPAWSAHEPTLLAQLFQHRKVELLLRFFRYKKRSSGQWQQLNLMYRDALDRALPDATDSTRQAANELERHYLQALLLDVMNTGQFSPREALWAYRWFTRWCSEPGLRLTRARGDDSPDARGFVVDLDGAEGLQRPTGSGHNLLHLDPSPMRALIDVEMAVLAKDTALSHRTAPAERAGQRALLNRLAILFAPVHVEISRRAERAPVAFTVQATAGFAFIVEELRKSGQARSGDNVVAAAGDENTISPFGSSTYSPLFAAGGQEGQAIFSIADRLSAMPQIWQVKDRSDTGCRMRGQIDNMNRVIPGSLIALRESEGAPWTVSVVRWFRRLMVDHVEIGVEYLGRKPRFIKLVADSDPDAAIDFGQKPAPRCFAALYLPPSAQFPTLPIKTILLPASEFRRGGEFTLLSSSATYRMRLNEAIQQQFEYVLTSFSIVGKAALPNHRMQ